MSRPADPTISQITQYPEDHVHVGRCFAIAAFAHFFTVAMICLIIYLLGIHSLKELLEHGGAIAQSGPAPEQQMIVELKIDDITPPPTDQIEFVKQVLKPKPQPIVPPPPKPVPKPVVKQVPKYTAPKATGAGVSEAISTASLGTSGLPAPGYPYQARLNRQEGTVRMHVVFDGSGGIVSADITGSSGVSLLDSWTRNFIYGHWKNASLAGKSIEVPITYDMAHATAH